MERIIGIVPAGGKATRVHGFFKEMMPIGINKNDNAKFTVSSEQIIESMLNGGATSVHFILSNLKDFIGSYFAKQHLFDGKVNFNFLTEQLENLGMPYTIDSIYDQAKTADYIMMGMPDTVIEPTTSFFSVFELLRQKEADLALGLYRTDNRNRGGYIQIDPESKRVIDHIDKTQPGFPEDAENAWAIVCWSKKFTTYMHKFLAKEISNTKRSGKELLFGDIIDAAIKTDTIHVVADYVNEKEGFYWDIAKPEKYFDLLRHYSPGGTPSELKPGAADGDSIKSLNKKDRIFIGHGRSSCWTDLRDFLEKKLNLKWEEFNRVPVAGTNTQERLHEMLGNAGFAFIVMTAEEEEEGEKVGARPNVIHELGLFQGKLGFKRAIVLLEEGCKEFSNIVGLSQIRFPKGDIMAKSEDIRDVLIREGILDQTVIPKK